MDYNHLNDDKTRIQWYLDKGVEVTLLSSGKKSNTKVGAPAEGFGDLFQHIVTGGNIGFRPGNTLLVIDVDVKGGKPGLESWAKLLPVPTFTVATPSGGRHFYYSKPADTKIRTTHPDFPGIDFLTATNNVVCFGSTLANGSSACAYTVANDMEIQPLPQNMLDIICSTDQKEAEHVSSMHEPTPIETLRLRLFNFDIEMLDYNSWWSVLVIIKHETREDPAAGFALAEEWSAQYKGSQGSKPHDPVEFEKQWRLIEDRQGDTLTIASLDRIVENCKVKEPVQSLADVEDVIVKPAPAQSFTESFTQSAQKKADPGPVPIAGKGYLPGIAGELEHWAGQCFHFRSPLMARLISLHCLSAVVDNRAVVGTTKTSLNLFTIAVAESGKGKDAIKRCVSRFVSEVLPDLDVGASPNTIKVPVVVGRFSSGSAVAKGLSRRQNRCWVQDEFGLFLQSTFQDNSHGADVMRVAMEAFTSARSELGAQEYTKAKDCSESVNFPYLQCIGITTQSTLAEAMSGANFIESGMVNRSLPIICKPEGERMFHNKDIPIPLTTLSWVAGFQDSSTVESPLEIPATDEARDHFQAFARRCDNITTAYAALWARAYENSLKIAGLVALGDTQVITLDLAKWATHAVECAYNDFLSLYVENVGRDRELDQETARILAAIRDLRGKKPNQTTLHPGGSAESAWKKGAVLKRDVMRKLGVKNKAIQEIIDTMVSLGLIVEISEKNSPSAKKSTYFLAEIATE